MFDFVFELWDGVAVPLFMWIYELISNFDLRAFIMGTVEFVFTLSLTHYLLLGALLFTIGLLGVMTRRNLIAVIISIEMMLNAANINFLAFSQYLGNSTGSVLVIFVIALAAAEVAVGLAIGLAAYRKRGTIDLEQFNVLHG